MWPWKSEFGILVHYGDSIDKVDDGLGIRVEGREVSEWPLYSYHYSTIH